jgi:hypothetical protein
MNEREEKNYQQVAGEWEHIQKLIPILKEMGYVDMHLYYEDVEVWVLQWHNPEHDFMRWQLEEG